MSSGMSQLPWFHFWTPKYDHRDHIPYLALRTSNNKYRGGTSDATNSSSLIVSLIMMSFDDFSDAPSHLYMRSCPSVGPYVPCYLRTPNMAVSEGEKSSNDIIINDTMSDDEVVASDVPLRY